MNYLTINATMLQTNRLGWESIDLITGLLCALYQLTSLATPMNQDYLPGHS
ncbi:hypothetical protein RB424 [Rhodopirellula baltica SH 1]|uniref:Uncharacterized protein n=1 Tax=Rhodopirellula baltica (strain DSM 10527 / NCIMB 13988 / SH1) TaxID=243090 RepID=Q7UYR7_RHOBA|nr:hypothetical protein RB424 [Rhodopirellula baltica SH 1]